MRLLIAGKPGAGKSSLAGRLLGRRAGLISVWEAPSARLPAERLGEADAVLLVMKVERYTAQEEAFFGELTGGLPAGTMSRRATVVFTHGDHLEVGIEEFISANAKLKKLIDRCGGRYHVVDNKYRAENDAEVESIVKTLETVGPDTRRMCEIL